MCRLEELLNYKLKANDQQVLQFICLSEDRGVSKISMADLAKFVGRSEENVRRSLRNLEEAGAITTRRTKRNYGKYTYNEYQVVSPSHKSEGWSESPSLVSEEMLESPTLESEGSTADYMEQQEQLLSIANLAKLPIVPIANLLNIKHNYHKGNVGVSNMNGKWKPQGEDRTGDDEIGGFGLLDFEKSEAPSQPAPKRSDPKTRWRRPKPDWTALDVAVEFSYRLSQKYPMLPGLVNTRNLSTTLSKFRKENGTTAEVELRLMEAFLADDRKHRDAMEKPKFLVSRFLSMFTTHLQQAKIDAPMVEDTTEVEEDKLTAMDGKAFPNTAFGRRKLEAYERSLRRENAE